MLKLNILFLCALVFAAVDATVPPTEDFHEELFVRPLADSHVNTYFQFTTRWRYGDRQNLHNTQLVPRAIAEILLEYDVKELHIGLTQGLWRYENWGYPVVDAATGAEVWAWFSSSNLTTAEVDVQWTKLASVFSGILCASLNFIDKTNSIEPRYGFRPQFVGRGNNNKNNDAKFIRYASLPRENVCTENLTPWKKLLPCSSKRGLASLLNSGHIHNIKYHSLGIKMRTLCRKGQDANCILELTQTANLVYDLKLMSESATEFSLRRLFGQGLNKYCVLANSSKIYVQLNEEGERYEMAPLPPYNVTSWRGGQQTIFGVYDIQSDKQVDRLFNIAWVQRKPGKHVPISPPIHAHRYILGHGQERGKIVTEVHNTHYAALPVILQEHIPWFVPIYLHTLKLKIITADGASSVNSEIEPQILHYIPGVQRTRPYHLELGFIVPAKATVQISFDFDYIFLKWLEYPPDANHGHYLGSAVLSTQLPTGRNYTAIPLEGHLFADCVNASRSNYFLSIHTEALILSLPTPDFSMPYNVICLACTVVALAFGPIHSVATKRIVVERMDAPPQTFVRRILHKLLRRNKQTTEPAESISSTASAEQPPDDDQVCTTSTSESISCDTDLNERNDEEE